MFWSAGNRNYSLPKGCKDLADVLKNASLKKKRVQKRKPLETNEEIRQVLRKHIPELAHGTWEIVTMARVVGRRFLVAVRPTNPIEAAGAMPRLRRGPELNAMIEELAGESPVFCRWNESGEAFVKQSFIGAELTITINGPKTATITLDKKVFNVINRGAPKTTQDSLMRLHSEMVQLVSEVTGWRISLAVVGEA